MKKITGVLKKLGQSYIEGAYNVYEMIQIGDHILTKFKIPKKLNGFLAEGLRTTNQMTLSIMAGKVIMAVQIEGQDRYIAKYNWAGMSFGGAVLLIAGYTVYSLSKSTFPLVGCTLLFYWLFLRTVFDYLKIAAEGGKKF